MLVKLWFNLSLRVKLKWCIGMFWHLEHLANDHKRWSHPHAYPAHPYHIFNHHHNTYHHCRHYDRLPYNDHYQIHNHYILMIKMLMIILIFISSVSTLKRGSRGPGGELCILNRMLPNPPEKWRLHESLFADWPVLMAPVTEPDPPGGHSYQVFLNIRYACLK